MIAKR